MKKCILVGFFIASAFCLINAVAEKSGTYTDSSSTVDVTLLGPKKYLRTNGKPNYYTEAFPGKAGQGKLIIRNGEADGRNRISSAIVRINGLEIFGTNDFSEQVYNLEVQVSLTESNTISVELRSSPGGYLTVQIRQVINADGAAVIGPDGGIVSVSNSQSPFYGFSCNIPPGSLMTPKILTISPSSIADRLSEFLPADTEQAGIPVEFGPSGLYFSNPILVKLKYFDSDDDGLIDGPRVPVEEVQALRLIDYAQQDNIPILSLDKIDHSVTFYVEHFSSFILTVPFKYIEYRWEMDTFSVPDWEEESQYGPFPWGPTWQYVFDEPLFDGYRGLKIWAHAFTQERIKLKSKNIEIFRDGTYIWRTFVPPLEPAGCGNIGAFLFKDDGSELDFEIGFGTEDERDKWRAKPGQFLCYMVNHVNGRSRAKPITGGWHELRIQITKVSGNIKKSSWFIDGDDCWPKDEDNDPSNDNEPFIDTDMNWRIYCSSEIQPGWLGEELPEQDFYAYFDFVKYRQPPGEEIFSSDFDDGTLQGWGTRDYSGLSTERSHSASYSIKVNDIVSGGDMAECYRIFSSVELGVVEFWMYVPSGNNFQNGISLTDQSSWYKHPNHRFYLSVFQDGLIRYYHNGQYHDFTCPALITFNTWNKLQIVWDSSANQMQLIINNQRKGTAKNWNSGGAIRQLIFQSGSWAGVDIYAYFDDVKVMRR